MTPDQFVFIEVVLVLCAGGSGCWWVLELARRRRRSRRFVARLAELERIRRTELDAPLSPSLFEQKARFASLWIPQWRRG